MKQRNTQQNKPTTVWDPVVSWEGDHRYHHHWLKTITIGWMNHYHHGILVIHGPWVQVPWFFTLRIPQVFTCLAICTNSHSVFVLSIHYSHLWKPQLFWRHWKLGISTRWKYMNYTISSPLASLIKSSWRGMGSLVGIARILYPIRWGNMSSKSHPRQPTAALAPGSPSERVNPTRLRHVSRLYLPHRDWRRGWLSSDQHC